MARYILYNPSAPETGARAHGPRLGHSLSESRAVAFANDKQHAAAAMLHVLDQLSERFGVINSGMVFRPTAAAAEPAVLDAVAREHDWALVGSAD